MTAKQLEKRINDFNDNQPLKDSGIQFELNHRNGYYCLDKIVPGTTAINNIECGTLKEITLTFNGIVYGYFLKTK